jgi:hypothetical protein
MRSFGILTNFDKFLQLFLLNILFEVIPTLKQMPLQDFLLPLENVKFHSQSFVQYAAKKYKVLISDKRIILYAQRGHLLKSDDIVSERLDRLQGIEYTENGLIFRTARINIQGTTKIGIEGPISEIKPLFHNLQSLINST